MGIMAWLRWGEWFWFIFRCRLNMYIGLGQWPATCSAPITLASSVTHSAGYPFFLQLSLHLLPVWPLSQCNDHIFLLQHIHRFWPCILSRASAAHGQEPQVTWQERGVIPVSKPIGLEAWCLPATNVSGSNESVLRILKNPKLLYS